MKKIRTFAYSFYNSITSVKYYKDVIDAPLKFSMRYFTVLVFFSAIIIATYLSASIIPEVKGQYNATLNEITEHFEEDLVITSSAEGLSINKTEPYMIPTPKSMQWEGTDIPDHFIVFDSEGTIDDYENKYSTLMLVNKVNLLTTSNKGIVMSYSLDQLPQGDFTKDDLITSFDELRDFMKVFPYIMFAISFAGVFVYYFLVKLFLLCVIALVLLVAGKVEKLNLDYTDYLQVALHSFTGVLVAQLLIFGLGDLISSLLDLGGVFVVPSFWFFGGNLLLSLFILMKLQRLVKNDVTYIDPKLLEGELVDEKEDSEGEILGENIKSSDGE